MGCRSRRPGTWGWNLGIGIMGRRREGTCCRRRPRRWACGSRAFPAFSLARRHPCFRPAGFRSSRAYPGSSCRGPRAFWKPVSETFLRRRSRLDLRAARVLNVERGTRDEGSRCLRARCAVRSRKRSGGGRVSLRRARAPCSDEGSDCEDVRRRIFAQTRAWTANKRSVSASVICPYGFVFWHNYGQYIYTHTVTCVHHLRLINFGKTNFFVRSPRTSPQLTGTGPS